MGRASFGKPWARMSSSGERVASAVSCVIACCISSLDLIGEASMSQVVLAFTVSPLVTANLSIRIHLCFMFSSSLIAACHPGCMSFNIAASLWRSSCVIS
eukprot:10912587-Karenia_brevis.AAC.1